MYLFVVRYNGTEISMINYEKENKNHFGLSVSDNIFGFSWRATTKVEESKNTFHSCWRLFTNSKNFKLSCSRRTELRIQLYFRQLWNSVRPLRSHLQHLLCDVSVPNGMECSMRRQLECPYDSIWSENNDRNVSKKFRIGLMYDPSLTRNIAWRPTRPIHRFCLPWERCLHLANSRPNHSPSANGKQSTDLCQEWRWFRSTRKDCENLKVVILQTTNYVVQLTSLMSIDRFMFLNLFLYPSSLYTAFSVRMIARSAALLQWLNFLMNDENKTFVKWLSLFRMLLMLAL